MGTAMAWSSAIGILMHIFPNNVRIGKGATLVRMIASRIAISQSYNQYCPSSKAKVKIKDKNNYS